MKPIEYYKYREQTYLKHLFLEKYLETVAYHIGFSQSEFVFVDCFSGPWHAVDEQLGDTSIRIALDRLNSVRNGLAQRRKYPTIRAIFVEKSPAAFIALEEVLDQYRGEIQTTALQGTFEENIGHILDYAGSGFTFFFVDPTGWTGFAMDNLRPILERAKGEVMINFMFDFINRFLSSHDAANEESLDRFFGTRDWRSIREAPDREAAAVKLYVEQVSAPQGASRTRPIHEC
ncbi:MAG: three-Cys-motif partner protein TcmP [Acidobacteriota bacterium]|nr:three-Cys-motif partner protein TcmP [Acidobacteriota bacterium]